MNSEMESSNSVSCSPYDLFKEEGMLSLSVVFERVFLCSPA